MCLASHSSHRLTGESVTRSWSSTRWRLWPLLAAPPINVHAANQKSPQHRLAQLGADPLELCSCPACLLPTSLPSSSSYTVAFASNNNPRISISISTVVATLTRINWLLYRHCALQLSYSVFTSLPRKLFISSIWLRWLKTASKRVTKVHASNPHNILSLRAKYSPSPSGATRHVASARCISASANAVTTLSCYLYVLTSSAMF